MDIAVRHRPTGYNELQESPLLLVGRKKVLVRRIALKYWESEGKRVDHRYSNSKKRAGPHSVKTRMPDTTVLRKDNLIPLTSYQKPVVRCGRK